MALRVTDRGHKTFVLVARYPLQPKHPTPRALGDYGALTLDQARRKARAWLEMIGHGIDPRVDEARKRAEAQRRQLNSFGAVAAEFLDRHVKGSAYLELERRAKLLREKEPQFDDRRALARIFADPENRELVRRSRQEGIVKKAEAERIINGEFVERWEVRPITDIAPEEVASAIRAIVQRGAPYQAHNAFGYIRRLFNWAIGTHEFGIEISPVERLQPKDLIGKRRRRQRTLSDGELRIVWQAAGEMGYPYGPFFRLLILNGQRESQVAHMRRAEVDFEKRLWLAPPANVKGDRPHEVPLTPKAVELLVSLPEWSGGDYFFSTTNGVKPINGFSKPKARIDGIIARIGAKEEGRAAADQNNEFPGWVIHDLRRTMRTHLSALPVEDLVRELVIGHAKPGLHQVYDQHAYQDEKRRCLELWEKRLLSIVESLPWNITDLSEVRPVLRAASDG